MAIMKSKDKWNKEHYTQIKIWADKELASTFKSVCDKNGVSYASVITSTMSEYCVTGTMKICIQERTSNTLLRRSDRRKAIRVIITSLEKIMTLESEYMDRIPENMQDGERHQAAGQSVDLIEEALAALNDAY
jgi:hypothetical protein